MTDTHTKIELATLREAVRQQGEAIERSQTLLVEMLRVVQELQRRLVTVAEVDYWGHTPEQQAKLRQVAADLRKEFGFDT